MIQKFEILDRVPDNLELSNNGGDYAFWRIVTVEDGHPVGVTFHTSSEFEYCERCGRFQPGCDCPADGSFSFFDVEGWKDGEVVK